MHVRRVLHDNLLASAESDSDRQFVAAEDGNVTHSQALDAGLRLAAGLKDAGVEHGDRVVLFMENT